MESDEIRLKRLRMRSWRRGMKEMDLILGPFADHALAGLSPDLLNDYEQVLAENDQDLYRWIMARAGGHSDGPPAIAAILDLIARAAFGRFSENNEHFKNMPQKIRPD
ncbi:MAG: succinate dehydrogenase assembly factor 2 [Paracoccus sp. (in: a-proteobacteria)]|nr:succinate dehydrogenase assembly factor 2 [Paracoccus sp. (in: a-proteobacteria)]